MPNHLQSIERDNTEYPELLSQAEGAPQKLYYAGALSALGYPGISVIGSRKMTPYGERVLHLLIPPLVQSGLAIVSGLAYGVDSYAHRVALQYNGRCVAVLGSGLERIYPQSNSQLAQQIIESEGCILSEYLPDVEARPYHFPVRNRIVAGLSPVTLIIEAGENSGTLITARQALDAGREVCVVPGDITREQSIGVHILLKQGARPVMNAQDILELYGQQLQLLEVKELRPALTGSLATLYDLISHGTSTVDELFIRSGLAIHEVQSVLSVLELDRYIVNKGNQWLPI